MTGILPMIDEENQVPKGSDDGLLKKLHGTHAKNSFYKQVSDLPCNIRREGGQSLVIEGSSLIILEANECNPF